MKKRQAKSYDINDDVEQDFDNPQTQVASAITHCELCGRDEIELTEHHLIPKSRHNKARTKREFSRSEMKNEIAMLCRPCHSQVHEVFTNQELSSFYNTVERLKEHSEMEKFINWVKKRPSGQTIRVKSGGSD